MPYEDEPTACLQPHNHSELYVGLWWGLSGSISSLCIVNFDAYQSYPFEKLASFVCSADVFSPAKAFGSLSRWQLHCCIAMLKLLYTDLFIGQQFHVGLCQAHSFHTLLAFCQRLSHYCSGCRWCTTVPRLTPLKLSIGTSQVCQCCVAAGLIMHTCHSRCSVVQTY